MSKYTIEGNVNFQEELYKLLDEDSDDETLVCQITGLPLKDNCVTLECKHHFNYEALYKEINRQKYYFRTYDVKTLSTTNLQKFNDSQLDYFIKCPYCRNIQFTILPYYEDLGLKQIYGINSLDKTLPNTMLINNQTKSYNSITPSYDPNYTFTLYKSIFKFGKCCYKTTFGDKCMSKYVCIIPNTESTYCVKHYKEKMNEVKFAAKKEKEKNNNERKKQLEEKNAEREAKGLTLLKRLPLPKKKVENIIEHQVDQIQLYVPEEDSLCNAILKSGLNKGKKCGCKKIEKNGLCKRHIQKEELVNKSTDNKDDKDN